MFAQKVQPNIRTFHLLTELWAELGRTSTLEQTIIAMQKNAFMLPDIFCLWHACRCYAKNGLMDKARYFFDRVLNEYDPSMDSHVDVVKNAAIDIITAYHRFSRDERHFQIERLEALQNAESFIVKIRESDKIRIEIIGMYWGFEFVFEASRLNKLLHCMKFPKRKSLPGIDSNAIFLSQFRDQTAPRPTVKGSQRGGNATDSSQDLDHQLSPSPPAR
jgi:hypothetical protein